MRYLRKVSLIGLFWVFALCVLIGGSSAGVYQIINEGDQLFAGLKAVHPGVNRILSQNHRGDISVVTAESDKGIVRFFLETDKQGNRVISRIIP